MVLIIGILASVALPQYQKAVQKARAVEILANVNALTKSAELYLLRGDKETIGHDAAEVPITGCVFPGDDIIHRYCYTNKAYYAFWCENGNRCHLEANHVEGCIVNGALDRSKCNWNHEWTISRGWVDGQKVRNECYTELTDTGRVICKNLESQGFEYMDRGS